MTAFEALAIKKSNKRIYDQQRNALRKEVDYLKADIESTEAKLEQVAAQNAELREAVIKHWAAFDSEGNICCCQCHSTADILSTIDFPHAPDCIVRRMETK